MKESSMALVDACKCEDLFEAIGDVAKSVEGIKEIHSVCMRKLGSYIVGNMNIVVSGEMRVRYADSIATQVEEKI
jgi:divalent metal cation (Fe/Co/Zn/Cd) transporter